MDATFTIPKTFLSVIKVREGELDRFLRRTLAVAFYRDGRLSLGKAAEFAGMKSKWEMIMLLDENNVPVDYSADDAESDIKTLKRHLGR